CGVPADPMGWYYCPWLLLRYLVHRRIHRPTQEEDSRIPGRRRYLVVYCRAFHQCVWGSVTLVCPSYTHVHGTFIPEYNQVSALHAVLANDNWTRYAFSCLH